MNKLISKFEMREFILQLLKAKWEGLSDAILTSLAKTLAKKVKTEDEATDLVEEMTLQQLMESYGDNRATAAQQSAVKNYEEKHGLKDGKKVSEGAPEDEDELEKKDTQPGGGDLAAQIKAAVEAAISPLQAELTEIKSVRKSDDRRKKLDDIVKVLPEKYRKVYGRIQLKDLSDEDFEGLMEEISEEVETLTKEEDGGKGLGFGRPGGASGGAAGAGKQATDKEVDAVVSGMNL